MSKNKFRFNYDSSKENDREDVIQETDGAANHGNHPYKLKALPNRSYECRKTA